MRRAVVATSATAAGIVLLLSLKPHGAVGTAAVGSTGPGTDAGSGAGTDTSTSTSSGGASASASSSASAGGVRSVTGAAANTRYGPVQVKVTLDGTRITKIDVVQYPSHDRRDQEINSYALPLLNQEAIDAQSAAIDVVSGATYTSQGYTGSLQSALDQAAGR